VWKDTQEDLTLLQKSLQEVVLEGVTDNRFRIRPARFTRKEVRKMSRLLYTVTVQFEVGATDTDEIVRRLEMIAAAGDVVETKAKAVSKKKTDG